MFNRGGNFLLLILDEEDFNFNSRFVIFCCNSAIVWMSFSDLFFKILFWFDKDNNCSLFLFFNSSTFDFVCSSCSLTFFKSNSFLFDTVKIKFFSFSFSDIFVFNWDTNKLTFFNLLSSSIFSFFKIFI